MSLNRIPEPEKMTETEEQYYSLADYAKPHDAFVADVLAGVSSKERLSLIDLGCGPGDILVRLRRKVSWQLCGVDLSEQMLLYARQRERRNVADDTISWVHADIKDTGLPANSFDVVISNSVLHHLSDPVRFWREVDRLAKPGAYVFVRDLRRPADPFHAQAILRQHVSTESQVVQEHYLSSLYSAYTVEEVREQLDWVNLHGLEVRLVEDRYFEVVGRVADCSTDLT